MRVSTPYVSLKRIATGGFSLMVESKKSEPIRLQKMSSVLWMLQNNENQMNQKQNTNCNAEVPEATYSIEKLTS